jgi:hypothetical protein
MTQRANGGLPAEERRRYDPILNFTFWIRAYFLSYFIDPSNLMIKLIWMPHKFLIFQFDLRK